MKPLQRGFYEIPSEEMMDAKLEKQRTKGGLKWRRVEYSYVESKIKGQFKICSMRLGQSSKYKLDRECNGLWNSIGPPANATFECAKDDESNEFIRMARFGSPISNIIRLPKK